MKYVTRALFNGLQGDLDRPEGKAAEAKWESAWKAYQGHLKSILADLPSPMKAFSKTTLHDGIVESLERPTDGVLVLTVNAARNPWGPRGRFKLQFAGVRQVEGDAHLIGDDWLYEEVHLHEAARFEFHVMFSRSDFRVVADEIQVEEIRAESSTSA